MTKNIIVALIACIMLAAGVVRADEDDVFQIAPDNWCDDIIKPSNRVQSDDDALNGTCFVMNKIKIVWAGYLVANPKNHKLKYGKLEEVTNMACRKIFVPKSVTILSCQCERQEIDGEEYCVEPTWLIATK